MNLSTTARRLLVAAAVLLTLAIPAAVAVGLARDDAIPEPGDDPAASSPSGPVLPRPTRVAPGRAPNVVLVMADDMRADELRFMPRLRRLVQRNGLTFENSFAPYPLCCPSRASFLTGTYSHNHKVYWHKLPYGYGSFDDSRTLATSLHRAGYRTGFIGKYLNGYGVMPSAVSGEPSHTHVPAGWDDWRGAIESPDPDVVHGGTYNYFDIAFNVNGEIDNRYRGVYQSEVLGDFSTSMARKFGKQRKPFFMYVNYVAPHVGNPIEDDDPGWVTNANGERYRFSTPGRPDWVKGRFDRLIDRAAGLPRNGGPAEADVSDKPTAIARRTEPSPEERLLMREVARQRAESIFVMDRQIARLIDQLKRSGEWSNTVFVFTSDNGFFQGEHRMLTGKVLAYEPSLRVPLVVTGPGMRTGERRYDPITTIDLTATILDLAQADPPVPPDGESRLATMRRGDRGWAFPVLTEATHTDREGEEVKGFPGPRSAIGLRTPRYVLIRHHNGEHELYDLVEDPAQLRNVHDTEAYRDVRKELTGVWWKLRDCDGNDCREPLPPSLQAEPDTLADLTRGYWQEITRRYGW